MGSANAVQHSLKPQHPSECLQARNLTLEKGMVQEVQLSTPLAQWLPHWLGAAHGWRRGGPGMQPDQLLEAPPEAVRPCRACWPRSRALACLRGAGCLTKELERLQKALR